MDNWKSIKNRHPYEINNMGDVRNGITKRILRKHKHPKGYLMVSIKGKSVLIHRLIMEYYLTRKLDNNEIVHHINNDPLDNRLENLELSTNSNHSRCHIYNSPVYAKGEKLHNSKLKNDDIPIIREMLNEGYSCRAIAICFGVTKWTIQGIKNGETWKDF